MADDTQLPLSGKDVRLELLQAGVPVAIADQVTRSRVERVTTSIETKPMGTSEVYVDQEPDGWRGELELAENAPSTENFISAYDAAQRARIPFAVQIVSTKYYRDGSSKTHIYVNVKVDFESTNQRGQAGQVRLTWRSGSARI